MNLSDTDKIAVAVALFLDGGVAFDCCTTEPVLIMSSKDGIYKSFIGKDGFPHKLTTISMEEAIRQIIFAINAKISFRSYVGMSEGFDAGD